MILGGQFIQTSTSQRAIEGQQCPVCGDPACEAFEPCCSIECVEVYLRRCGYEDGERAFGERMARLARDALKQAKT